MTKNYTITYKRYKGDIYIMFQDGSSVLDACLDLRHRLAAEYGSAPDILWVWELGEPNGDGSEYRIFRFHDDMVTISLKPIVYHPPIVNIDVEDAEATADADSHESEDEDPTSVRHGYHSGN